MKTPTRSSLRIAGITIICFAFPLLIWLNLPWLTAKGKSLVLTRNGFKPNPFAAQHQSAGRAIPPSKNMQANATLGFQRIFVVSSEDPSNPASWRQKGLIAAANRTGVSLELIPTRELKSWELRNIRAESKDATACWAAHNRALRRIVQEDIQTALIMEDDMDWDIDTRKLLAPEAQIATSIRALTESNPTLDASLWPYGDRFDVLWLGHCGGSKVTDPQPNVTFADSSVLPANQISIVGNETYVGAPDGHRRVRVTSGVVCTFAYAVTPASAAKLLQGRRNPEANIDMEMNAACRGDLRCLTVHPELFHQQRMVGGRGSLVAEVNEGQHSAATEGRPITFNIRYSARCNAGLEDSKRVQCLPRPADRFEFNG